MEEGARLVLSTLDGLEGRRLYGLLINAGSRTRDDRLVPSVSLIGILKVCLSLRSRSILRFATGWLGSREHEAPP